MILKKMIVATLGVACLAGVSAAQAAAYAPGEYLLLDLKTAVLSPKPLGPSAAFEHVPIEARADAKNEIDAAADKPRAMIRKPIAVPKTARSATAQARPAPRNRVARARSNPMDANAADTRVQVWPCRSGGICNWQKK